MFSGPVSSGKLRGRGTHFQLAGTVAEGFLPFPLRAAKELGPPAGDSRWKPVGLVRGGFPASLALGENHFSAAHCLFAFCRALVGQA